MLAANPEDIPAEPAGGNRRGTGDEKQTVESNLGEVACGTGRKGDIGRPRRGHVPDNGSGHSGRSAPSRRSAGYCPVPPRIAGCRRSQGHVDGCEGCLHLALGQRPLKDECVEVAGSRTAPRGLQLFKAHLHGLNVGADPVHGGLDIGRLELQQFGVYGDDTHG